MNRIAKGAFSGVAVALTSLVTLPILFFLAVYAGLSSEHPESMAGVWTLISVPLGVCAIVSLTAFFLGGVVATRIGGWRAAITAAGGVSVLGLIILAPFALLGLGQGGSEAALVWPMPLTALLPAAMLIGAASVHLRAASRESNQAKTDWALGNKVILGMTIILVGSAVLGFRYLEPTRLYHRQVNAMVAEYTRLDAKEAMIIKRYPAGNTSPGLSESFRPIHERWISLDLRRFHVKAPQGEFEQLLLLERAIGWRMCASESLAATPPDWEHYQRWMDLARDEYALYEASARTR